MNITSANTVIVNSNDDKSDILDVTVLDLLNHPKKTRNPENAEVWAWTFVNRPELLTRKAKLNIMNNLMNQRSPFTRVGRITDAALKAYSQR